MCYDLVKIEYQHDFILKVTFKDGTSGFVDFAKEINSIKPYNALNDIDLFKIAYIHPELHTLTWSDDLDYDPILLYYKANNIPFPESWEITA